MVAGSTPSHSPVDDTNAPDRTAAPNPYAEIVAASRETGSRPKFLGQALRVVTRFFASPYAAIHVRYSAEVIEDDFHVGVADPKFWKSSLQDFLTDALSEPGPSAKVLRSKTGDTRVAFISAPLADGDGASVGAMALVIAPVTEDELPARMATLEALAHLASACTDRVGAPAARDSGSGAGGSPTMTGAVAKALHHAAGFESAEELAFSITNELRNTLGCEQVSLGLVEGRRVRVLSISGLDQINRRNPGVQSLGAAMEECLDAREPIVYPRGSDWEEHPIAATYRIHRQWQIAAKGDAVASIPLNLGDDPAAILSLRAQPDRPFSSERITAIRSQVEPFAPALRLAKKASRGVLRHAADVCGGAIGSLMRPEAVGRKVAAAVGVAMLLAFFFGTLPYNLTVSCVVTPARARHVSAPFDGVLSAVSAVQGDRVVKGQVLCEFDGRDVAQQVAALTAELNVADSERDRAMGTSSPVEVKLAEAKRELVKARLVIAQRRAERAVVRAPIDGIVVAGDLRKQVGGTIPKGRPLFEIAPADEWSIELAVPEYAAAELHVGLGGRFLSHARPDQATHFTVTRVRPKAETRAARNVYIAEAKLTGPSGDVRPGMEGVARVGMGSKPVYWLVLHRVVDFLRLHFWL